MNISKANLGLIGRIVAVIGLSAGLAACGDEATTASSAGAGSATVSGSFGPKSGTTSTPAGTATTAPVSTPPASTPAATAQAVTLSWAAPTQNTDGSALTNLSGFDIYYGTSSASLTQKISINSVGLLTYVVENLNSGTWFFEVVAVNAAGVQSGPSSVVSASI
jgi:hypothetical protein